MTELNDEYTRDQRLILYRLGELKDDISGARTDLTKDIKELRASVSALKIATASRGAAWGAVGSLPALIVALVALLKLFR